jgi:hypothetical protein
MENKNTPNPDWYLEGESNFRPNQEILSTILNAKTRAKRDQEVGLKNLEDKHIYLKKPNNTIWDIVNAIGLIPKSDGSAIRLPKIEMEVRNLPMEAQHKCWVTSLPFIIGTEAEVRNLSMGSDKECLATPCYSNFMHAAAGEGKEVSVLTKEGDSVFCFVWYSILSADEDNILPFEIEDGWEQFKITESLVIGGLSHRVACFIKKEKGNGEKTSVTIYNTGSHRINFCLFDYWGYSKTPEIAGEYSGTGAQQVSKNYDEDFLWIFRACENDGYEFNISPETMKKYRIYDMDIKQNAIIIDRDEKGDRTMSYQGSKAYSFFSVRFIEEE